MKTNDKLMLSTLVRYYKKDLTRLINRAKVISTGKSSLENDLYDLLVDFVNKKVKNDLSSSRFGLVITSSIEEMFSWQIIVKQILLTEDIT
ncbi:MAG: hypothetical protein PHS44_05240 [Candidatus Dojkabacteria bacterium]|jgi:hypothetical protein|nr:hypothetical protein [Candidatus Dojkabacteria bacterium]